ncbi:hypothetical protein GJ496_004348 [Pomphorhynchus laevis]|nr:hypothetical protein GJ496_004348 [Pomphorhynchus laevis]
MSKRGPMDKFIKSRQLVAEDTSNSEADDGVIETEVLPSKRIRTVFTRKYDSSYIQFGFVATNDGEVPKPLCVICGDVLANHSMKPSHLKRHLNTKHKEMSSKSKEFFARKHVDLKSRQKQIFKVSRTNTCALRASYKNTVLNKTDEKLMGDAVHPNFYADNEEDRLQDYFSTSPEPDNVTNGVNDDDKRVYSKEEKKWLDDTLYANFYADDEEDRFLDYFSTSPKPDDIKNRMNGDDKRIYSKEEQKSFMDALHAMFYPDNDRFQDYL